MAKAPSKFTFKKEKRETGLSGVGNPWPSTDIKLNGMVVGQIRAPNWQTPDNLWRLSFMVVDTDAGCGWKWIFLKITFKTEPEAREFVNKNFGVITTKWTLRQDCEAD